MEKNLLWLKNPDLQSRDSNYFSALLNIEPQSSVPAFMKLYAKKVVPNGYLPSYASNGLAQLRESEPRLPLNLLQCLPRFRQDYPPLLNSLPKERLPAAAVESVGGRGNVAIQNGRAQKQFLVFDQSGDKTTLVYSSEIGACVPSLNSWEPKLPAARNWLKDELQFNGDAVSPLGCSPFLNDEYVEENLKDDSEGEMHEDTEELNALLYSDDESDYSEDNEETSTGHSPSSMTAHRVQDCFEGKGEEVASSAGSTKRQKTSDGGFGKPSVTDTALMDTASSLKRNAHSELEDDAQSSCGNGAQGPTKLSSFSGKKRPRKEYIHDTIRMLQSMIPDGKGKNAIDIIDEAIHYLRSLKAKAKDSGLATLRD